MQITAASPREGTMLRCHKTPSSLVFTHDDRLSPFAMPDTPLALFEEHRQLLFNIAYRMLGTVMDAQDMVQNTFIRWHQTPTTEIQSPRAWLTTVITRLCINHLQSARVQRESYVGPWLPEPLVSDSAPQPDENLQLADSLSLAFLVLLETLTPTERAVFLLREVFDCEFAEIATIVDRTETNCRQILTRARKHVENRRPRFDAAPEKAEELLEKFERAVKEGEVENLIDLLASDVVLITDGGGKARAILHPVAGAQPLARLFIQARRKFAAPTEVTFHATVNGLPGLVAFENGQAKRVIALGLQQGRIHSVFIITNPDKIRHLTLPV